MRLHLMGDFTGAADALANAIKQHPERAAQEGHGLHLVLCCRSRIESTRAILHADQTTWRWARFGNASLGARCVLKALSPPDARLTPDT